MRSEVFVSRERASYRAGGISYSIDLGPDRIMDGHPLNNGLKQDNSTPEQHPTREDNSISVFKAVDAIMSAHEQGLPTNTPAAQEALQ